MKNNQVFKIKEGRLKGRIIVFSKLHNMHVVAATPTQPTMLWGWGSEAKKENVEEIDLNKERWVHNHLLKEEKSDYIKD